MNCCTHKSGTILDSPQVILVILMVFLLLPATTLYGLESNWNWLDSFYYCFISLTTVSINSLLQAVVIIWSSAGTGWTPSTTASSHLPRTVSTPCS